MAQLCLVMQGTWDDIPKARIAHLSPFMPRRCRVMDEAHGLSQPLLTLLHLTGCCTEQNATINFYLAKDDSRQIADLTHAKQFLWVVFTIVKFPVEIAVRFFSITLSKLFCMKIHHCGFKQHPLCSTTPIVFEIPCKFCCHGFLWHSLENVEIMLTTTSFNKGSWSIYQIMTPQIASFMGPTWGLLGSCRPQVGPMLAPWILLSGSGYAL